MTLLKQLNTPVFAAEGIQYLDKEQYRLLIKPFREGEKYFTFEQLRNEFPQSKLSFRLTSVTRWSVRADWNGILWTDFENKLGVSALLTHVLFKSSSLYTTCVSREALRLSTAMIVWGVEDEPLEAEYGGPIRVVVPNLWGYKSCKWLVEIGFIDHYVRGFWESRGYTDTGTIEAGFIFDVNTKTRKRNTGGEIKEF